MMGLTLSDALDFVMEEDITTCVCCGRTTNALRRPKTWLRIELLFDAPSDLYWGICTGCAKKLKAWIKAARKEHEKS